MSSFNPKAVDKLQHPIEGEKIIVRDKMTDAGERTYIDFDEFDYITKKALRGLSPSDNIIKLSSGLNPIPLVNGVHFISPSLMPLVLQTSEPQYPSVDDTKLTTEGASLRVDYNYSDNTKSTLVSIDVWVSDDTIDTWIRII
jgi:hypothetical protein